MLALCATTAGAGVVTFDWANIGNAGNTADTTGYGAVGYGYSISKHEVTNGQYIEFLSAVAAVDDVNGLYNVNMAGVYGGIVRTGDGRVADPYVYSPKGGDANWLSRPVNFVSWYDAVRFANWLHNGQPSGVQDATTTEDGAYDMSLGMSITRKSDAQYFLPTEDEWYKAAYFDPNHGGPGVPGYWDYATGSDTAPTPEDPGGTEMTHGSANYWYLSYVDSVYRNTAVGAYDAKPSASSYGTFDQNGNVWEWNETVIAPGVRGVRGGSSDMNHLWMRSSMRSWNAASCEIGSNRGFRIGAIEGVPEPASVTLLAFGLLSILIWWRRRR
jgi:formylglycine-generating enzyme